MMMAALYGQWALWSNPSLPVGESDKGVGADKGQIYFGIQSSYTYIDWWHEALVEENFDHKGTLNTISFKPSILYENQSEISTLRNQSEYEDFEIDPTL